MIIEFYGLPGSGKTTAITALTKRGYKKIEVNNKLEILFRSFVFALRFPLFYLKNLYYIATKSEEFKVMVFWGFLNRTAKYQKASTKRGIVLLDEGLWQHALSLFAIGQSKKFFWRYLGMIPVKSNVILIEKPNFRRENLIKKRINIVKKETDKQDRESWIVCMERHDEYIREKITRNNQEAVFITNNGTPKELIEKCEAAIKKYETSS